MKVTTTKKIEEEWKMKKLTKGFKKNEGFTLMEIIIVIVILGILALIAVPRLIGFTTQAEIATDKEYAAVVARAAELYWAANDKEEPNIANLTSADMVDEPSKALKHYKYVNIEFDVGVATVTLSGGEADDISYNSEDGYKATGTAIGANPITPSGSN
jgi:prepilin-type N-terminal cleavage/methylation domain-containing protein